MHKSYSFLKKWLGVLKKSKFMPRKIYMITSALVLVIILGGYFAYREYSSVKQDYSEIKKENQRLSDPQEASKQETEQTKNRVAQLIDVPQGEDPTIASVVDASKLSGQAFFKNAQNGDKVLMYAQAKKAIMYRPSTNKIIEVAPINLGDSPTSEQNTPAPPANQAPHR